MTRRAAVSRHEAGQHVPSDEELLNQGFVRIVQYRDDWLKVLGWIEGQRPSAHTPQPAFITRLVASIEDAI